MKKKLKYLTVATVAGLQFTLPSLAQNAAATPATNDSSSATQAAEIEALKAEVQALAQKVNALETQPAPATNSTTVQDLDQKVRVLERERENDQADAAALAKTQPKISLSSDGFTFSSADTNFVAQLHGFIQLDNRSFFDNPKLPAGTDGFLLRRARPIFTGTVFHDFDFNFTPDFGGSSVQIQDAYLNYRYNQPLQLEAGKFKSPVGLEILQNDAYVAFNERSLATDLLPNRDLGVQLHGDIFNGALSYAAALLDGAPDYNGTTFNTAPDNGRAFAGRIFAQPWKTSGITALQGLGFGAGGSYENDRASTANTQLTGGYTTDGQEKFFTYASTAYASGTHWRVSPQAYYYYGPFSLLGEYAISDQEVVGGAVTGKKAVDLQNSAWELTTGWVLTGEDAGYNGVTPLHPFNLHSGGWGAWQIVARYADLDVDDNAFKDKFAAAGSASEARAVSIGLNWYLNRNIRVNASFSHTTFDGVTGTPTAVTKQAENALFTRIQLAF